MNDAVSPRPQQLLDGANAMPPPAPPGFPVVGIGASAGGVAALLRFFENMPRFSGMAYVVILHLSPEHESHADLILQGVTSIPVRQVRETVHIEVDHAYVISPAQKLEMFDGQLHVSAHERPRGGRPAAIDLFFRTLAQVHRQRAFCVVLSGTGSDGAVGLSRIKEQGGVTLVQSPEDAEYDSMPRSAIQTGMVDLVLPVAEMPDKLMQIWANAQRIEIPQAEEPVPARQPPGGAAVAEAEGALRDIMNALRERTGHDFTHYKRATVLRRIERRMQVNRVATLPQYRDHFESHAAEAQALLKDLLIGVTNFFRDRDAFEALERDAIAPLFEQAAVGQPLRAWTAGCATGEEAYSVAILLQEQAMRLARPPPLQIFATDIDEQAIAFARHACYPETIYTDVPPARLREFFEQEPGHYRVAKPVREKVLFAVHNVLRDPPFSRLSLITCRNLLIYLDREVQAQLLELFHFALEPGGFLFLGSSETAEVADGLFQVVDKKHRLYRTRDTGQRRALPAISLRDGAPPSGPRGNAHVTPEGPRPQRRPAPSAYAELHRRMLERHAPPSVLADQRGHMLHVGAEAARFLRQPGGPPSTDLVALVLPELRLELRTAIFHAVRQDESVEARRVRLELDGKPMFVNMSVRPLADAEVGAKLLLVTFDACAATLSPGPGLAGEGKDPALVELERELQLTKEQLLGSIDTSQVSEEELRASNEELQAMNEELRSATEELETSKEELQSVNEELITVNHELRAKVEETGKVNDDLRNLIAATDIATVFIDRGMRIKRFTPRAAAVFNLIGGDVGRSLLDITHRLDYDRLADDAAEAFDSLRTIERELRASDGHWYLVRVLPYRTLEDRIEGAVLNFIEITERRRAEEQLRAGEQRMRLIAESTRDYAIVTLDLEGRVTSWNQGAERVFGWAEGEILGQPAALLFTPEDRAAGADRQELEGARRDGRAEDERWQLRKDGARIYCSGITMPLVEDGVHRGYAKICRDLTATQQLKAERDRLLEQERELTGQLKAASVMKDEFLAVMSHELKNPLNLIHVNAELLARLPQAQAVPAVARAAEVIRRTVKTQAQIIDDLLDLSRVHTGKLALERAPVAWGRLLEGIAAAAQPEAQANGLALALELEPELPAVHADAVRVEQIVWNLLSNALKFTRAGGRIVLRLRREGAFCRLDVEDTGKGIALAFIGQVFDMFRQGEGHSRREQGGLGIGLALVRQLAELHGGRVAAASAGPEQGSCFSVWLPVDADAPGATASPGQAPALEGLAVLLVDDTADALESFGQLLELLGVRLRAVASGAEALKLAERERFDLVISDIGMPGMDGYELIGRLRALPAFATVPAIALTGYGRPGDRQRALEAGYNSHLAKPVALATLLEVIGRIVPARPAAAS